MAAPLRKPCIARYYGSKTTQRDAWPEKAGQTYKSAAFVYTDANGQVTECDGAVPGNITKILAIDSNAASGTTDYKRSLEPISSDHEILMSFYNTNDPSLAVTSQALVGDQYAIRKITSGGEDYWVVDGFNAVDKCVQIMRIAPEDAVGTQFGAVYVKVLKSLLQYEP